MASWMVAIFPNSRQELDRLKPPPPAPRHQDHFHPPPHHALPNPLVPVPSSAVVSDQSPPRKEGLHNPNAVESGESSGAGAPNQPPSYSDLFDQYDPARRK